jgi:hypothetical protein
MAPSARFRRAHSRGKNCGENTEIRVVDYSPSVLPLDSARHAPGMVRGLQLIDLCRENCDYKVPAAAQPGGGPIEQGHSGKEWPFPALILLFTCLLSSALTCQRSFHALPFAGLQVKGVTFHFLDDVLLLDFSLETAQCVF